MDLKAGSAVFAKASNLLMNMPFLNIFSRFSLTQAGRTFVATAALAASFSGQAQAQTSVVVAAAPSYPAYSTFSRWDSSIAAFAASDREKPPSADGVLFVGSSTIRMWSSLAQDFRQVPVIINRGFGGSTMADCDHFARDLVTRYRPKQVLVYAGDNDLAEGRTPQQVLASFTNFARVVRTELPGTRISYISIKPSPSRASLLPKIREANGLIGAYVSTLGNADYIDIFTPMLAADGNPRPELFRADQLHMNDVGYAVWQSVIASHITLPAAPSNPVSPAVAVETTPTLQQVKLSVTR